ncbi:MAG: trigger factor [Alphaproteobacteria bacterium]|nr:trigger factor [Alphaproteobacteria bacterium]
MQIAKVFSEKLKYQFKITAPLKELQERVNAQLGKIGSKAKIPGFRPGKIPEAVLKQRYGAEAWENAGNSLLREGLTQIYKEHKFRNAIDPVIDVVSFEDGKDFECTVTFEILPEIEVKNFKDISVELLSVEVSDKDVEERLEKIRAEHTKYQAPSQARAAQKGDLVSVKWAGTLEDGKRMELPQQYQILLGPEKENSPFAPIVKTLYGKKVGDTFEGKVHFSKEEKVPELAGKKATVSVEVQKIEEPITFKLDNTFAKEYKVENIEELRKSVRGAVEHESKKIAYLYTKRKLLDILDSQYDFDLPPTMVENEFKVIWEQLQRELADARANGELDEDEEQKTEDELKKDYEKIAKRRVRLGLLISHLAEINKLKLSDEEVRAAVFQEAMRYPSQADDVIKHYVNNNQALKNLVAPLLEDKVVDFILGKSKVTERNVDFPTLKMVVRGVIPTPYDDEEGLETPSEKKGQKAKSVETSKEKKSTAGKAKPAKKK